MTCIEFFRRTTDIMHTLMETKGDLFLARTKMAELDTEDLEEKTYIMEAITGELRE